MAQPLHGHITSWRTGAKAAAAVASSIDGGSLRTTLRFGGVLLVVGLAACSGTKEPADAGFLEDLELASAATPLTLQKSDNAAQVVSAIERTSPPPIRRVVPSRRVAKYKPAPRTVRAPVETAAEADAEREPEQGLVSEVPVEDASLPSPRPQPVYSPGVSVDGDGAGNGRGDGIGTVIGVVLRGGHAGIDDCDPRTDRRRRGGMAVNNRIPVIGTFPAGRIQGTFPGSGRMTASLPRAGRSRF